MSKKQKYPLIEYLERLATGSDRAVLATLRTSLREGRELDALAIVLPYLGEKSRNRWAEDDAMLVAGLFALHPVSGSISLGAGLRKVAKDSGSDSIEARFRALMGASREDLPVHLRHAVALLAGREIGIDWNDLYRTVRYWRGDDKRHWARDFWTPKEPPRQDDGDANSSTQAQQPSTL